VGKKNRLKQAIEKRKPLAKAKKTSTIPKGERPKSSSRWKTEPGGRVMMSARGGGKRGGGSTANKPTTEGIKNSAKKGRRL